MFTLGNQFNLVVATVCKLLYQTFCIICCVIREAPFPFRQFIILYSSSTFEKYVLATTSTNRHLEGSDGTMVHTNFFHSIGIAAYIIYSPHLHGVFTIIIRLKQR